MREGILFLSLHKRFGTKKDNHPTNDKTLVQFPVQFIVSVTYQKRQNIQTKTKQTHPHTLRIAFRVWCACVYICILSPRYLFLIRLTGLMLREGEYSLCWSKWLREGVFTMFIILTFIIWYRRREVSLCSSFCCWFSESGTKKQLIVWRHIGIEYPLKLSSGVCCELRSSVRVAGRLG